jgi:hypothetical protein
VGVEVAVSVAAAACFVVRCSGELGEMADRGRGLELWLICMDFGATLEVVWEVCSEVVKLGA